ncbi:envelope stress response membrane protein PspC [Aliidiomarina taiwanensis]|uniref:Envelope stress response membrane protein PspC n=1 Tax=Aliidiomarina taiwanensis TaxID=946228 RepID=A0A432X9V7_9GAMM|nr:envelope stress response membrane protein PspC [Aliidiomarina taiwanensis]RUO44203.1 envelope stress response membrane protein PspC [Aliidiomarina taiwanensis]
MAAKKRLYRNHREGKVAGVCAGIADYFGWEVWAVRILFVTTLIFAFSLTFVVYIAAWLVLDKKPAMLEHMSEHQGYREETRFEQASDGRTIEVKTRVWEAGKTPKEALKDLVQEFHTLEGKVCDMERCVTSSQYRLRQEINQL